MSTPKIYTSQQFQDDSNAAHSCPRCHQQEDIYIQLGCGHKFCVVCITFAYLKYKNTLQQKNKIRCLECEKLSQMDDELLELINEIISKELGPIMKGQDQGNNQSRMSINVKGSIQNQKQGKRVNTRSEQASMFVNNALTPPKNSNYFYSKCQSPHNSSLINNQTDCCMMHPTQQISYICMTCSLKPLCYKCIKSNKHANHQVKIVKKAFQIIQQKLSLLSLQTAQKMQNIQLYMRRIYDRKQIFQERIQKSIKQIRQIFASLEKKITQKSIQIVSEYQGFYEVKIQEMEAKAEENKQALRQIQAFQEKVRHFIITGNENSYEKKIVSAIRPSKLLQYYQQIQNQRQLIFQSQSFGLPKQKGNAFNLYQNVLDPVLYQNTYLLKSISRITESIQTLAFPSLLFGQSLYENQNPQNHLFNETVPYLSIMKSQMLFADKNKTVGVRNCSSRQKLEKNEKNSQENPAKRIKTNVPVSLNTSRDKRNKRHPATKTQQDQRRIKSKANYKTQANTLVSKPSTQKQITTQNNKQLPSYITKCIQKHNISRKVSPFSGGTVYLMENLHSSKNVSKILSKNSHILYNDDMNNRKRNKQAQTNKEKKSVNAEGKQLLKNVKNSQGVRKKK